MAHHEAKIARACKIAAVGSYPRTCAAMLSHLPSALIARVTARELAMALDAMWAACREAKAIAERDAIDEGAIWDARSERLREIAA